MRKKYIIILAVLVIFIVGLIAISKPVSQKGTEDNKGIQSSGNNQNPDQNTQEATEESHSSNSNNAGGSGETTIYNPVTDCPTIQIAYALKNLNQNQTCNQYEGQTCIDKTVYCSIEVFNLDETTEGQFTVNFESLDQETEIANQEVSHTISPKQTQVFQSSIQFQNENADKNIECSFKTVEIPRKDNC